MAKDDPKTKIEAPAEDVETDKPAKAPAPEPVEIKEAEEQAEASPQSDPEPEPEVEAKTDPAPDVASTPEPKTSAPLVADEPAEAEPEPEPEKPEIQLPKQLLFGRWDLSSVVVSDPGLARYINLHSFRLPHTGARHANRPFAKAKVTVVERLINDMMRTERYTGKKNKAYAVVREAFEIMGRKGDQNPVQLLVTAIENSAPKEATTSLRYGGIRIFKAVDMSPSRRLDFALRNLSEGAIQGSHGSKQTIASSLAKELRKAADNNTDSYAVSKKEEVERRAESAR